MIELQAFLAAVIGGVIFSIIGIIPGTDETATMAPLTLVVVLLGFPPVVIFAWFVGILVAMQLSDYFFDIQNAKQIAFYFINTNHIF